MSLPVSSYNFKILLSYLQIAVTLVNLTEIPWPSAFQTFLQAFSFVNLNFVWAPPSPGLMIACLVLY
jgi:hypothetical protein